MAKLKKTYQELVTYMWKIYPEDDQLPERTAMLEAWNFMTGVVDVHEKERKEIAKRIKEKLINDGR